MATSLIPLPPLAIDRKHTRTPKCVRVLQENYLVAMAVQAGAVVRREQAKSGMNRTTD